MVWTRGENGFVPYSYTMVLMAKVRGERASGRHRLGWMDGVKLTLDSRGMTVQAARQCANVRKEWRALVHIYRRLSCRRPFLLRSCSFGPLSRALVACHFEWGGMPLHDEVGKHCVKGATTENQDLGAYCMG